MKNGRKITHTIGFKVFLFILLGLSFAAGIGFTVAGMYVGELGGYISTREKCIYNAMRPTAERHLYGFGRGGGSFSSQQEITEQLDRESAEGGIAYRLVRNGVLKYDSYEGGETPYVYTIEMEMVVAKLESVYELTLYIDDNFPEQNEFRMIYRVAGFLYDFRYWILVIVAGSALLCIISFVWLLCNAGKRRDQEGIVPSILTVIPLDVLAVVWGLAALLPIYILFKERVIRANGTEGFILSLLLGTGELVWCTFFCRELALRMKLGKWWRNTLIYRLLRLFVRIVRAVCGGLGQLVQSLPMILHVVLLTLILTICEFVGIAYLTNGEETVMVCWLLEKLILIPLTLYCALAFKKLQNGSRALAEGNLSYHTDTRYLVLDFKKHGENLNKIGEGISRAVEQKMRSERLKTELITNVSHDLKTPLTSVINYASLLGSEAAKEGGGLDRDKAAEYSEVLLRQSNRLKKLLDDLLEASKASTGNLDVSPVPCELGVLLTQAVGEYETRFAEKGLAIHVRQPEEEIRILADGRHLWRVFDNLLGNCYKYAQENTRVYLNLEKSGEYVEVVFRNMSKYELNVSAEELEERFVRGDKARHMEGNGLGLSIAKSLVELQRGTMQIITDGDLFKVILRFPVMEETSPTC